MVVNAQTWTGYAVRIKRDGNQLKLKVRCRDEYKSPTIVIMLRNNNQHCDADLRTIKVDFGHRPWLTCIIVRLTRWTAVYCTYCTPMADNCEESIITTPNSWTTLIQNIELDSEVTVQVVTSQGLFLPWLPVKVRNSSIPGASLMEHHPKAQRKSSLAKALIALTIRNDIALKTIDQYGSGEIKPTYLHLGDLRWYEWNVLQLIQCFSLRFWPKQLLQLFNKFVAK